MKYAESDMEYDSANIEIAIYKDQAWDKVMALPDDASCHDVRHLAT